VRLSFSPGQHCHLAVRAHRTRRLQHQPTHDPALGRDPLTVLPPPGPIHTLAPIRSRGSGTFGTGPPTIRQRVRSSFTRSRNGETVRPESLKVQLSKWENGKVIPDRFTMGVIAEVFSTSIDVLFGIEGSRDLPRPVLLEAHVTDRTVELLQAQRAVHVRTEHSFGPIEAASLVSADLATIGGLLPVTPRDLEGPMHALVALTAELGGWIAQDSGNIVQARRLTNEAQSYARGCDDRGIQAMILMRLANIETVGDPRLAARLAQEAAELVGTLTPCRLHATIARQQAHAAAALADIAGFERYAAQGADYSQADPGDNHLTPYADRAYIASETAAGLLVLGRPEAAVEALAPHVEGWIEGQERDHAVALCRWLRALAAIGDYTTALDHIDTVLASYRRAPSMHAKTALRAITAHPDNADQLPATELRRRLITALEGTRHP